METLKEVKALEIGDILLIKDDSEVRAPYPIIAIAEDNKGTKLYRVRAYGYYTERQLYEKFERVTILEEWTSPTPDAEDE